MDSLPTWIDREAWDGFVAMRKLIKKPLTERAKKMALATLYEMRQKGHDPNASLAQSEFHNWQDLYVPKAREAIEAAPKVEETRAGVEAIAQRKGMQKWDECEQWEAYRSRVMAAAPLRLVG